MTSSAGAASRRSSSRVSGCTSGGAAEGTDHCCEAASRAHPMSWTLRGGRLTADGPEIRLKITCPDRDRPCPSACLQGELTESFRTSPERDHETMPPESVRIPDHAAGDEDGDGIPFASAIGNATLRLPRYPSSKVTTTLSEQRGLPKHAERVEGSRHHAISSRCAAKFLGCTQR